jgi:Xaa-Pro aminopeptidase
MTADTKSRLKRLKKALGKSGLSSMLVTRDANVAYLSGFTGSDSMLVITADSQFFLTDSRYIEEARDTVTGFNITDVAPSAYEAIGSIVRANRIKRMAFESMHMPYDVVRHLGQRLGRVSLVPLKNVVEGLRAVKDEREIALIKRSAGLTKRTLKAVIGKIRPGTPEAEAAAALECAYIKSGAKPSFPSIVASGANSSRPHARPTSRRIAKNDIVMIDTGCSLDGYNSDITRTVMVGSVKDEIKKIYGIVKSAERFALDAVAAGRKASEIDRAGRQYIKDKGYGKFFGHSMGHGVGLEVHEEPSISEKSGAVLEPGMVFTIEPAIYIPRLGGVRIEDMVLVTEKGRELLTA